jgi:hypothetical protein
MDFVHLCQIIIVIISCGFGICCVLECAKFSQLTIYFYFFYQNCSKSPDSRLALVGGQPNRVRLKCIYFHLFKPILAKWSQK